MTRFLISSLITTAPDEAKSASLGGNGSNERELAMSSVASNQKGSLCPSILKAKGFWKSTNSESEKSTFANAGIPRHVPRKQIIVK